METVEHSRPPPLPSKLRWRPYSSETKKLKKEEEILLQRQQQHHQQQKKRLQDQQRARNDLNPKALAHKVRGVKQHSPVAVHLQWEEAETIESMSHGGHPQNNAQHHHHEIYQRRASISDTESTISTSSASRRAASTLPSPPPSNSPNLSRLALLGDTPEMGHLRAKTDPEFIGDEFLEHGLALPKASLETYQVALNALLENHRRNQMLDAKQAQALALKSTLPMPMSIASPPATLSDSTFNHPMFPISASIICSSGSQRRLSSTELLGIANIDDLLASCGYTDYIENNADTKAAAISLASPVITDKSSLHSSPVNKIMESPSLMDISAASFDMLLAQQTPVLLAEGDSKRALMQQQILHQQQQQHQQQAHFEPSPTLSAASTTTNTFAEIIHDLASPFVRLTSHGDPLINGYGNDNPSSWPSLFPKAASYNSSSAVPAPRVDIATQTDLFHDKDNNNVLRKQQQRTEPLSPHRSGITSFESSPLLMTHLELTQEEVDPEWLSYLDDASPILGNAEIGSAMEFSTSDLPVPPLSPRMSPGSSPASPTMRNKQTSATPGSVGDWAKGFLKTGSMAPTGHRSFPTAGPMGSIGSMGAGGMIRTLAGGNSFQQRSSYHTKARRTTAVGGSVAPPFEVPAASKKTSSSQELSNDGAEKTTKSEASISLSPAAAQVTATAKQLNKDISTRFHSKQEPEGFSGLVALFRGLWKAGTGRD